MFERLQKAGHPVVMLTEQVKLNRESLGVIFVENSIRKQNNIIIFSLIIMSGYVDIYRNTNTLKP